MVMAVGFWHWSLSTRLATRVYITKCMWVAGAWAWIVKVQHVQYTSVCRNAITSGTCKRWWQFRENWVSIAEQSEVKNQVLSVRYCTFSKASWSPTVFFISFKYSSSLTRVTRALSKVMTPPPPCRPGSGLRLTGTSSTDRQGYSCFTRGYISAKFMEEFSQKCTIWATYKKNGQTRFLSSRIHK